MFGWPHPPAYKVMLQSTIRAYSSILLSLLVALEPHKVAAEWQSEEGTKFLLRRKIVICGRGSMKE